MNLGVLTAPPTVIVKEPAKPRSSDASPKWMDSAFGALLSAWRMESQDKTVRRNAAPPSQVFESSSTPANPRLDAMRAQARREDLQPDPRPDAGDKPLPFSKSMRENDAIQASSDDAQGAHSAPARERTVPALPRASSAQTGPSMETFRATMKDASPAVPPSDSPSASWSAQSAPSSDKGSSLPPPQATVWRVRQTVPPAEVPARQIAQWLASRVAKSLPGGAEFSRGGSSATQANVELPTAPKTSARSADSAPRSSNRPAPSSAGATNFEDLVHAFKAVSNGSRSSATLHLDPPELGRLRVDVHMIGDDVTIEVKTRFHQVGRLMTEHLTDLRDALAEHGLHVKSFNVIDLSLPRPADALLKQRLDTSLHRHDDMSSRRHADASFHPRGDASLHPHEDAFLHRHDGQGFGLFEERLPPRADDRRDAPESEGFPRRAPSRPGLDPTSPENEFEEPDLLTLGRLDLRA